MVWHSAAEEVHRVPLTFSVASTGLTCSGIIAKPSFTLVFYKKLFFGGLKIQILPKAIIHMPNINQISPSPVFNHLTIMLGLPAGGNLTRDPLCQNPNELIHLLR